MANLPLEFFQVSETPLIAYSLKKDSFGNVFLIIHSKMLSRSSISHSNALFFLGEKIPKLNRPRPTRFGWVLLITLDLIDATERQH